MEDQLGECLEVEGVSFKTIGQLKPITLDYLFSDKIKSFHTFTPSWEGIENAIKERQHHQPERNTLVEVLKAQYKDVAKSQKTTENIEHLGNEDTFTFTTGHQLSLFTGPSYFFYKIISVIKLAQEANSRFSEQHFVPLFWMASEDHDFEEIATTVVEGKKITWEHESRGPVGRFSLEGLQEAFTLFQKEVGINPDSIPLWEKMEEFINHSSNYADFVRRLVNHLFGDFGLVILDADDQRLKQKLIPVIQEDLFHHNTRDKAEETSRALEKLGCTDQIYVREVNFFYMKDGFRERIEHNGDLFKVLNSSLSFSHAEMMHEVKAHPERFSPNVSLRPVYQELILPNIAYVGGGAEVAYWLQLKAAFESHHTFFPVVLLRDSALILPQKAKKWLVEMGLQSKDLFRNKQKVFQEIVKKETKKDLSLSEQKKKIEEVFEALKPKVKSIQPTLERTVEGEKVKILNRLATVEKKLLREEKRNHTVHENRLEKLFALAFPEGTLQERKENFLPWYIRGKAPLLSCLLKHFDATDASLKVVFFNTQQ